MIPVTEITDNITDNIAPPKVLFILYTRPKTKANVPLEIKFINSPYGPVSLTDKNSRIATIPADVTPYMGPYIKETIAIIASLKSKVKKLTLNLNINVRIKAIAVKTEVIATFLR